MIPDRTCFHSSRGSRVRGRKRRALRLASYLLAWPLAFSSGAFSDGDSAPSSEAEYDAFVTSLTSLAESANGTHLAYRYRRVVFEEGEDGSEPAHVQEGVLRLFYSLESLLLEESYTDQIVDDAFAAVYRRRTQLISLLSGEIVTHDSRFGTSQNGVWIDYWTSVPRIMVFAMGFARTLPWQGFIAVREPIADRESPDVHRWNLSHPSDSGLRCVLELEAESTPFLREMVFVANEDTLVEILRFSDPIAGLPGGPSRPSSIIRTKLGRGGMPREVVVYQALRDDGVSEPSGWIVPSGSVIMDRRGQTDLVRGVPLADALPLSAVASFPYDDSEYGEDAPDEQDIRAPGEAGDPALAGGEVLLATSLIAFIGGASLHFFIRRRKQCCKH